MKKGEIMKEKDNGGKVLKAILRRNRGVVTLFLIAVIVAISFLVSMDMPEWFDGAHNWFEFFYNVSLSIIAGFIFYCYQVILPNYRRDNIREVLMKYELRQFSEYLDTFYRDLTVLTGYYSGYQLNTTNFIEKIPDGFSELYEFDNDNTNNCIKQGLYFQLRRSENIEYIKSIDKQIDRIKSDYIDYLDPDIMIEILKMKNDTYIISTVLKNSLNNNESDENNEKMIKAVKKMYHTLRSIQISLKITPLYSASTFEKIDFSL